MKAAVLTSNGVLEVLERPIPAVGDGQYLIRIDCAGVCNSDIFRAFADGAYSYPLVMGHEIAARVVEPGRGAKLYEKDQPVVVFPLIPCRTCDSCRKQQWALCAGYDYFGSRRDGGFQQYLAADEWNLLPAPGGLDAGCACLCEPVAVAVNAARQAPCGEPDATACVIGAGVIGLTTAKLLAAKGYRTTVIDRNPFKLEIARSMGLQTLEAQAADAEDGFSLIVTAAGDPVLFNRSLRLARPGATVIWVANITGPLALERKEVSAILRKRLTIRGVWNSDYRRGRGDDWAEALRLMGREQWIRRLVTHRISLKKLPETLEQLYSLKTEPRPHGMLKVVVEMGNA